MPFNEDNAQRLLHSLDAPTFSEVAISTGVAIQNTDADHWATYLVQINGGTAGTVEVAVGPTDVPAHTIVAATAANAVASQVLTIRVPAKWWFVVTTTVATIVSEAQVMIEGNATNV
jgi:hypothetical protein